jgi:hypothetical protein
MAGPQTNGAPDLLGRDSTRPPPLLEQLTHQVWAWVVLGFPLLWHFPFTQEIQDALIASDNMGGTITNSDLEQLALVCHPNVLTSHHNIRKHTICALSDNTAAVSQDRRGSTSVNAPSAYLCRLASIHQRAHRYRVNADYLPGPLNIMADNLSCRWDLSDSQILAYFNSNYPQMQSWRLCHLWPALISTAMKALWMQHCDPASLSADKPRLPPSGTSGPTSVCNTTWSPTSPKDLMQKTGSKYLLQNTAISLGAADLIRLAFFFLLHWEEHTISGKSPHPFTLAEVRLWHHDMPIDPLMVSPDSLLPATFVILIFMDHKNAVCGKTVGHGCSGDPQACPVLAVIHRILHLRSFHAPPNTPLCALNAIGGSSGETQLTCPCLVAHFKLIRKQERNVNLWILVSVVDACCRVLASQYWPACTNKFARTKSDAQN